jgi:hypothetical protein
VAVTATPWAGAKWRLEAEEIVSPINPEQFAAYAQLATRGTGYAPQPDRSLRRGLRVEQQLPGGITVAAQGSDWRYASVTDLGPVGAAEAPVSIGRGTRQQLDLDLKAPLSAVGLAGATLAGDVSWRKTQVVDPFTGQRRPFSGEAPYRAQLRLSGELPTLGVNWALLAAADGPQSIYQMSQVTSLGATTGVGGALTYGAGRAQVSLQLDNLLGGSRQVTTFNYAGSRAEGGPSEVQRREDDARAVRISLHRPL